MEKLKMHSLNKVEANIAAIGKLFPNCVTERMGENGEVETAIDFDMLKQELSSVIVEGNEERYQFTWPDKKKAILAANAPISATLRPCREESVDFDTTQNLYIEGDNLDVLKLLQETYLGKIKLIYIDPPYNTGNDFVYNDDFAENADDYLANSGQYDERGNRLLPNLESEGRFHTKWLNMMYQRLKVARDFLTDDGLILVSIDDCEMSNLTKICDEIFGRSNNICCFNWNTKKAAQGMTTAHMVVDNHEYVLCYAKNSDGFKFRGMDRDENNGFSNPDNDPRGLWKRQYLQRLGQGLPKRTITDPKTGNKFTFETPYTQEKLDRWIREGRILFPETTDKYPARKEFLNEYENKQQLVTSLGLYATKATTEKLYSLFDNTKIFTNPKPDTLIHFLVQQTTQSDSIIMDFFSGSATSAHAVMQLNAEDGGSRRFIMVQVPEIIDEKSEAYKAGYKNICEIGKERIRRAGKKIKEESPLTTQNLDIGFRVLKLDSSNMKDVYYNPDDMTQDIFSMLSDNIKEDRTPEDLLFQVMLDRGIPLSSKIEESVIAGKKVFNVEDNFLIACFDTNLTNDVIQAIAQMKPYYFVMRDSSMADDSVAANFDQVFATYSPDTDRKVI